MSHIIKREWVLEFAHFLLFGENNMLLESGARMFQNSGNIFGPRLSF
jgi:hypothetical protein